MLIFHGRFRYSWAVLAVWLFVVAGFGLLPLFRDHWPVSVTMVFGSFIAGATAEGGGAVAFPVFTKVLHIAPMTARDFAFAIQSIGMTCGSLLIVRSGYPFLPGVLGWAFPGAALAVMFGMTFLAPLVPPPVSKLFFTLFTTCFGMFLLLTSRASSERAQTIALDTWKRRGGFFVTGVVGGLVSSLVGSGADVVLFVVLCLRYGIDEKVGTRTTVFLMAGVSMVGFLFRGLTGQLSPEVLKMWVCAAPIVAFGAPLGAAFCSFQKREHVVAFLVSLIALEFATTLWIIPISTTQAGFSLMFCLVCLGTMFLLRRETLSLAS